MYKAQNILALFSILLFLSKTYTINLVMIHDVIESFNCPACVIGFLCNKTVERQFSKFFTSKGLSSVVVHTSENVLPYYCLLWSVFILDFKCRNSSYILEMANRLGLFTPPNRWMIIFDNEFNSHTTDSMYSAFDGINILVDSEVMVIDYNEKNFFYIIQKIYKVNDNLRIIFENFGRWDEKKGYNILETNAVTANRRKNLRGTVLKTCLVITHNDSLNHLLDKRDKHIDSIAKVNFVFMLHLGDLLNANMEFSIQPTWGYQSNNSEWSGMIGELTRKEADIGGTPLFLTSDRVSIIDYIAMTTPTKSKFVFRQPKLSYITNVFTLPFETTVWIAICALVVVTAVGLYIIIICEWTNKYPNKTDTTESELEPNFAAIFLLVFGAACQQGASAIPYSISGRIITIISFVSLMFLYTSYSANIVALLQSSSTSIQTLSDLLNSRLQVGVDDTVFNHYYFPNAKDPIRKAIYQRKVAPPGRKPRFYPIEEGVGKMRQGLFAFHMETGAGYKLVVETFFENEKCDLEEIQFLQVPDPWLAIQKKSSYKEMLKIGFRKIHESGIQSREVALLYTKKPECISRGTSFVEVTIIDCFPAILTFFIGVAIGFIIFILEMFYYYRLKFLRRYKNTKSMKNDYIE